nr:hypothetical protein [Arenimonas daejeonensis]
MTDPDLHIRPIRPTDDAAVADIIRSVMPEFGASGRVSPSTTPRSRPCARPTTAPGPPTSWSRWMAGCWAVVAWRRWTAGPRACASCARCISCRNCAAAAPAPR